MSIFDFLDKYKIPYKNKDLIIQACTHSSYVNEHKKVTGDNERLEFLGDSVLQLYTSHHLYEINPPLKEGVMSTRRSNLVSEKPLAAIVREFGLNEFLLLGVGEEKSGGRDRDSIISDMFEALVGAVFLDSGFEGACKLLDVLILKHIETIDESVFDYKTRLQEYIQADSRRSISYETISITGSHNDPSFDVVVKVDGLVFGKGSGHSKKEAQKAAAKDALEKMAK